ncbi:DUF6415 family natural product biosynthesis protein [Streptomyces sp. NPDC057445]|uniref:DUF6415 family natural product biosynthesis protein n=1 Tax=Streptomyces sp. NPDC057445 TaxID=3346136 RepID=UPI0036A020AA
MTISTLAPLGLPPGRPGHPMPAERVESPLNVEQLALVLQALKSSWTPFDPNAVFDLLDRVLGDHTPQPHETPELTESLRGTLLQLVNIAVSDTRRPTTKTIEDAVEQARAVHDELLPSDCPSALGLTRRLARVTWELLELLIAAREVKDAE